MTQHRVRIVTALRSQLEAGLLKLSIAATIFVAGGSLATLTINDFLLF